MCSLPIFHDDEEHLCGCDLDFNSKDSTADEDLPRATGGVAISGEGDEVDGCDVDFDSVEATSDADLPAATGGVL